MQPRMRFVGDSCRTIKQCRRRMAISRRLWLTSCRASRGRGRRCLRQLMKSCCRLRRQDPSCPRPRTACAGCPTWPAECRACGAPRQRPCSPRETRPRCPPPPCRTASYAPGFSRLPGAPAALYPSRSDRSRSAGPSHVPLCRGLPGPAPSARRTQAFALSAAQRWWGGTDGPIGVCPLRGL